MAEDSSGILWIGPVVGSETLAHWTALSPAANRWQSGFINALRGAGRNVEVLGHIPEPLWPRGVLRVPAVDERLSCGTTTHSVHYWNMPWARPWALRHAYLQRARPILEERRLDAVITYNITPATYAIGVRARKLDVPWIAIIADTPVNRHERETHDRLASEASGRVYLSWSSYQAGLAPKLHIDGGVEPVRRSGNQNETGSLRRIVYAGSVAKYAGVKLLVDAFQQCRLDCELWICGKGDDPDVTAAAGRDPRIKRLGFVTDEELERISMQADVFVNPRGSFGNEGNFPSKVLEYLAYLRPVVSTWTPGLSPEFRDVLVTSGDETPASLAAAIEGALGWNAARRDAYAAKVEKFLIERRSWAHQARRFNEWLARDVIHTTDRGIKYKTTHLGA